MDLGKIAQRLDAECELLLSSCNPTLETSLRGPPTVAAVEEYPSGSSRGPALAEGAVSHPTAGPSV